MAEQESVLSQLLCAGHYAETEAPSETQGAKRASEMGFAPSSFVGPSKDKLLIFPADIRPKT